LTVRLMLGDCLDRMKEIADGSVDLVFTSPPYNLGNNRGQYKQAGGQWRNAKLADGYASYSDDMPRDQYVAWQKAVLTECWRLLSPTGAIYYNHKPRVQNNVLQTPFELNPGLPLRQIVIWKRSGGFNFSPSFYLPTHEWVMILAKPGFRLRDRSASGAKDVWEVVQDRGNEHPAPFPVALPAIAIETTSAKVILDPFMGSGTTGVAAVQAGRDFIGIELDPAYHAMAEKRITEAQGSGLFLMAAE
jgi:site-specific DNA-methyltransferase (adenine-specific)